MIGVFMLEKLLKRKSLRLPGWDYSHPGAYYVTICTQDIEQVFGEVVDGEMCANNIGEMISRAWKQLPKRFPNIELDEYIAMPNHFHCIIWIVGAGSPRPASTHTNQTCAPHIPTRTHPDYAKKYCNVERVRYDTVGASYVGGETPPLRTLVCTLGQIVGYFKYQTTKQINIIQNIPGSRLWQRNYYDHIIRNDEDLNRIRTYIRNNPQQWSIDQNKKT